MFVISFVGCFCFNSCILSLILRCCFVLFVGGVCWFCLVFGCLHGCWLFIWCFVLFAVIGSLGWCLCLGLLWIAGAVDC